MPKHKGPHPLNPEEMEDITMTLYELNPDELQELTKHYYNDKHPEGINWAEILKNDKLDEELVKFEELEKEYKGVEFVPEDFPETRKREQVQRICAKLDAMTPEELREFADFLKEYRPDIWQILFADVYGD